VTDRGQISPQYGAITQRGTVCGPWAGFTVP
jgi:hypothetical protein